MSAAFVALRVLFGLVFLAAAVSKAAWPVEFAVIVANYQILPDALVNPVALLLPWVEIVCGAALVAGVWPRGASLVLGGLLVVFLAALGFNVMRGLSVQCGCFTVSPQADVSMHADMIRDAVVLAVGLLVFGHAVWEERRRRASARFWEVFSRPAGAGVPGGGSAAPGGTLVLGGAAAPSRPGDADPAQRASGPDPVFAAPEAAAALALETQREEGRAEDAPSAPPRAGEAPEAPGTLEAPGSPQAPGAAVTPESPGAPADAQTPGDDEDTRKL